MLSPKREFILTLPISNCIQATIEYFTDTTTGHYNLNYSNPLSRFPYLQTDITLDWKYGYTIFVPEELVLLFSYIPFGFLTYSAAVK